MEWFESSWIGVFFFCFFVLAESKEDRECGKRGWVQRYRYLGVLSSQEYGTRRGRLIEVDMKSGDDVWYPWMRKFPDWELGHFF